MSREDADLDRWTDEETDSLRADREGGAVERDGDGSDPAIDRPDTREETVELGVELLAGLADDSLSVKAAVDRIESVTTNVAVTREILDTAETRGVIQREQATIQTTGGSSIRLDRRTYTKDGEFECRRCGASLSTGYFVRFDSGDMGPFGSTCIRKVTGRE